MVDLRFQVADLLKMPHDSEIFKAILEDLPSDSWPDDSAMNKIYNKKGLKRYRLHDVEGFVKKLKQETEEEEFAHVADQATTGTSLKSLQLAASSGSVEQKVTIKIEKHWVAFNEKLTMAQSGKAALEKKENEASEIYAEMELRKDDIGAKAWVDAESIMTALRDCLQKLRTALAAARLLKKESDQASIESATITLNEMGVETMIHVDGIKSTMKRWRSLLA